MLLFFLLQAAAIVGLSVASSQETPSGVLLIGLAALVGANYGSNLALFPSVTKDFFGLKNFGMNYGLVFTAWGVGGFILAQFAARVFDGKIVEAWGGSYSFAFYTSAALLLLAGALTFVIKPPHHEETTTA
jgi:MFS family permease